MNEFPDEPTDREIGAAEPEITRQAVVDQKLVEQSRRKLDRFSALIVVTGEDRSPLAVSSNTLMGLWLVMGSRLWEYRRYLRAPPRSGAEP